ncbi:hypothetical protein Hypma_004940 [Hypsizygus marmoreus]|uniref:Uncharacterized protein n=1 Tax=Hypsizygus marmoreus TaxID=39966 RepID=A0A369K324_HYPMA|nr:hypothetical protein Hypma_004940 [Hypsizygus marmoreus]
MYIEEVNTVTYCDNEGMQDTDRRVQQAILQRQGTTTSSAPTVCSVGPVWFMQARVLVGIPIPTFEVRKFKMNSAHASCWCDEGRLRAQKTTEIFTGRRFSESITVSVEAMGELFDPHSYRLIYCSSLDLGLR